MRRFATTVLAAGLAAACGGGSAQSAAAEAGAKVFRAQACATCHGTDGAGTPFGPTLQGKKAFWTREKLVEYLKNPQAYAEKDPRLAAQAKKFTLPMQRFDKVPPEELDAVAEYVLAMP